MAIQTPTKSKEIIIALQAVTHPGTVKSTQVDVSGKFSCVVYLYHALVEAVANTNPGIFKVQTNPSTTDEDWVDAYTAQVTDATPATEALTATEAIGSTVIDVASTTGFAALDDVFMQDSGTVADGEFATVEQIVANTSVDLVHGLTRAKDSADFIWGSAQKFTVPVNLDGVSQLQVVFMHEGATGANAQVKAIAYYLDSISA